MSNKIITIDFRSTDRGTILITGGKEGKMKAFKNRDELLDVLANELGALPEIAVVEQVPIAPAPKPEKASKPAKAEKRERWQDETIEDWELSIADYKKRMAMKEVGNG